MTAASSFSVAHASPDDIDTAARALLQGALVVLPTETVYGLAARADDPAAVQRIYDVKGRPPGHPLIVHVADGLAALSGTWGAQASDLARTLATEFWPGPVTLVVPRGPRTPDIVTGGQSTVAIRVPSHPVAAAVLRRMDEIDPSGAPHGVAAPSANRFGRVSPTTYRDAHGEIAHHLGSGDIVLDGGRCEIGVESTIVDCTGPLPRILRPGGVTAEQIAEVCQCSPEQVRDGATDIRVPGSLPSHYAPDAQVVICPDLHAAIALLMAHVEAGASVHRIGLIAPASEPTPEGVQRLAAPVTSEEYARELYAGLRRADAEGLALVLAIPPADDGGPFDAVLDRLHRAAAPR
jgi:L-threonylcarbamoyladenylate synthase